MAKKQVDIDFAFFKYLRAYYQKYRGKVRFHYKDLTKKFLDFNDPENANAFLRKPQFEALEMYVFLKEYCNNERIYNIFADWYKGENRFVGSDPAYGSGTLFGTLEPKQYEVAFKQMKNFEHSSQYSNYIFALTMGTGKTILMATCIFYEFLLANKFPKDERFCHNALVFAPDKTVLHSLNEIITFDKSKVIPKEYVAWLDTHLKFYFLDESGTALTTLDGSMFNVIISNTQKIILKEQHKGKNKVEELFSEGVYAEYAYLYGESELLKNQRFEKLIKLEQIGIYVDEAHHAFGTALAKDLGDSKNTTSLRKTINQIAEELEERNTHVVACYNYTGTPYVGNQVLPEVVYAYGLDEAIKNKYLKTVKVNGYSNTKTKEFLKIIVKDFWEKYGENRYEGKLPKLALFAATIDELNKDLRPALEKVLTEMNIPIDKILINVGDDKLTSNDDIREFIRLDSPHSSKQFILLVNKGKEGWNCRSLFGVALYRKPKSKVFVLQATMRCLRSIGDVQEEGSVYLSDENMEILESELEQNFRLGIDDMNNTGEKNKKYEVRLVPPPVKIKIKRTRKLYQLKKKELPNEIDLELSKIDKEKYLLSHTEGTLNDVREKKGKVEDITHEKESQTFSRITLCAEISRYLNHSPIEIEELLESEAKGIDGIINAVNEHNEILYDWIIPRLFNNLYSLKDFQDEEDEEIDLVKEPKEGYYVVQANPELTVMMSNTEFSDFVNRSFHLDTYCFDSEPEKAFFMKHLSEKNVKKIYFTGMLTHGQSDFFIHYIAPDSHAIRSYYPDFLIETSDGKWIIVEIKGEHMIDDPVVQAKKEYAELMASSSKMTYEILSSNEAKAGQKILIH